jgi:hypothetical protein
MVNYQLGKVYKIIGNGKIYVGSTCEKLLCQRLSGHNRTYKFYQKGNGNNMTSFQCLSDPNHYIELVELYPCDSKDESHKCERKWIEQLDCVNKFLPGRTHKEYCDTHKEQKKIYLDKNKEQIKEQKKIYYEDNKEQRKEQVQQYYDTHKEQIKEQRRQRREKAKQQIKLFI